MHEPLAGSVDPIGEVGMPGNPAVLDTDTTSLIITELTPNTNYSITVYANTSAGRGDSSIEVNQTDEDSKTLMPCTLTFDLFLFIL